jgi:hypothetical protein
VGASTANLYQLLIMEKLNGIDALIQYLPQVQYDTEVLFQEDGNDFTLCVTEEKQCKWNQALVQHELTNDDYESVIRAKIESVNNSELTSSWSGDTINYAVAECLYDMNWINMDDFDVLVGIPEVPEVEFSIDESDLPDISNWF